MVREKIIIYQGTENFKLGIKRISFRNFIRRNPIEFKKTIWSTSSSEDYGDFHLFYNDEDLSEAVEFFQDSKIYLDGENLIGKTREEIRNLLLKKDSDLIEDDFGIISKKLSIGISCPTDIVDAVLIAINGYFDKFTEKEEVEENEFDVEGIDYKFDYDLFKIKEKPMKS
ncbi:MAG: hypothetical protein ACRDD2_02195 [Sarcina sp.]